MLNYIITIAISAFFVPHYLSIFWEPLKTTPWDIIVGAVVIALLVLINIVGVREAARLNIGLAIIDFATQLLLVIIGFALIFSPHTLVANIHWGVAPTWSNFLLAIPIGMVAYTGIETVSNLAEEARDPARNVPRAYLMTVDRRLRDLLHAAGDRGHGSPRPSRRPPLPGRVRPLPDRARVRAARGLPERSRPRARREPRNLERHAAAHDEDLRRDPGGDDPVHRDERGRDRSVPHHLRDGASTGSCRRSSGACTSASGRRGSR